MSVNGITTSSSAYSTAATSTASATTTGKKSNGSTTFKDSQKSSVVYEKTADNTSKTYTQDMDTVNKLKQDAERHTQQLRSLVEKLLLKQGNSYTIASDSDMYQLLREGKLEVDPQTAAQAQKDIAEDGYWGVEQTSDRIVSFAKALTGGDPEKADEMISAFLKGYKDATKSWDSELPDLCKKTYDATMDKLNAWKNGTEETTDK